MSQPDFRLKRQKPLGLQAYDRLRTMMQARVFSPGERMIEEDLARRLSISRTPVREALFRLELNGLVEQREGRFVVPRLTIRDIHEIFQIRRLLEPQAVADIAEVTIDTDMSAYIAARDRMVAAAGDQDAAAAANIAFRGLWMSRIPNRRLHDTIARFDDQVMLVRRATLGEPAARAAAAQGACALVEAFATRDPQAARQVMEGFIDSALAWFERAVGEQADADAT